MQLRIILVFTLLFLLSLLILALAQIYLISPKETPTLTQTPQILAKYKFEQNLNDETGIFNLTNYSAVQYTKGVSGWGIKFNKTNMSSDRLLISDSPAFNLENNFTISLWWKLNSKIDGDPITDIPLIGKHDIYSIYLASDSCDCGGTCCNTPMLYTSRFIHGDMVCLSNSTDVDNDEWQQVVAVYEDINGKVKLYVNGTLIASKNITKIPDYESLSENKDTKELWLGARWFVLDNYKTFNGSIDEVVIYNNTLTDLEIKQEFINMKLNKQGGKNE